MYGPGCRTGPVLETGSQRPMPQEWIDKDTGHRILRISRVEGSNASFYFHNNPFYGNKMVFYNSTDSLGRRAFTVDLQSLETEPLTSAGHRAGGEIVDNERGDIYYQWKDSVFATNIDSKKTRLIFVFPAGFKATISTLNADATFLAGRYSDGVREKEIYARFPEKSQYFNRIFDAKLPNLLFTINIKTGELKKIHHENTWLGHVQFSPADPNLLMFCHEGPWHKVDRIWTINIATGAVRNIHKRSVDMEIAGHEFFAPDGQTIWFDNQVPRSTTFYLTGTDVKTGKE